MDLLDDRLENGAHLFFEKNGVGNKNSDTLENNGSNNLTKYFDT